MVEGFLQVNAPTNKVELTEMMKLNADHTSVTETTFCSIIMSSSSKLVLTATCAEKVPNIQLEENGQGKSPFMCPQRLRMQPFCLCTPS